MSLSRLPALLKMSERAAVPGGLDPCASKENLSGDFLTGPNPVDARLTGIPFTIFNDHIKRNSDYPREIHGQSSASKSKV